MKACGGDLQFEGPGWNSCTVDMIRVAKAHSMLVLQQTFADAVDKLQRAVSSHFIDLLIDLFIYLFTPVPACALALARWSHLLWSCVYTRFNQTSQCAAASRGCCRGKVHRV